jgi:O-antigen/teichoic acid export membrane protein
MPLILGGLAFWGLIAADKVFLRKLASFEELGVYSVVVNFAAAAAILPSVFATVRAPTVYKWASTGQGLENVHRVSRYILALVVLGFSLAGPRKMHEKPSCDGVCRASLIEIIMVI